jgi:hypothetical protein
MSNDGQISHAMDNKSSTSSVSSNVHDSKLFSKHSSQNNRNQLQSTMILTTPINHKPQHIQGNRSKGKNYIHNSNNQENKCTITNNNDNKKETLKNSHRREKNGVNSSIPNANVVRKVLKNHNVSKQINHGSMKASATNNHKSKICKLNTTKLYNNRHRLDIKSYHEQKFKAATKSNKHYDNYNKNVMKKSLTQNHASGFREVATLKNAAVKQVEYFFSVDELVKNIYMRKHMDVEGFLPAAIIFNFPSVLSCCVPYYDLLDALKNSNVVEVDIANECLRIKGGEEQYKRWLFPNADGTYGCPKWIIARNDPKEVEEKKEDCRTQYETDVCEERPALQELCHSNNDDKCGKC